jgi:hypothetical protein
MSRDQPDPLTIRNQRYPRWPWVVSCSSVVALGMSTCVFVALPLPRAAAVVVGTVAFLAFVGAIVFGMFVPLPPESLSFGAELRPRPGFPAYPPDRIRQIAFAPDPVEDYVEGRTAVPLCKTRIDFRPHGGLGLILTVADARRLRVWAAARGIEVVETAGVLESTRNEP